MRKIYELQRIINSLPYLNFSDQEILLKDLEYVRNSLNDVRNKSNIQENRIFLDQKLTYVKQSIESTKANNFNAESLRMIHVLYEPIFEKKKELGDEKMVDVKRELGLQFDKDEIFGHEFHTQFRGYDREQVDELLDKIIKDYDLMFKEIERLRSNAAPTQNFEFATAYDLDVLKQRVNRLEDLLLRR